MGPKKSLQTLLSAGREAAQLTRTRSPGKKPPQRPPYQRSIAAEVLLVLPRVFRVTLLQVLPKVVCRDVPTAACTLAPPPISSRLPQDENLFSSQKAELEENMQRSQNSRQPSSWHFRRGSVVSPPSPGPIAATSKRTQWAIIQTHNF